MSKQSLNERFNEASVEFIKKVFTEHLKMELNAITDEKLNSFFKGIYIQDTTKFALPENMKHEFSGYNGAVKAKSLANIYFKYEMLRGHISSLKVAPGTYPDQEFARNELDNTVKDSLYLSDLGFFSLDYIDRILTEKAYFISRIKPKMKLYKLVKGQYIELSVKKILHDLQKGNRSCYDFEGFIGSKRKEKIPVRFVITMASEETYMARLRKVNKQNKSYGNQTSEKYRLYARLNIFITNLKNEDFKAEDIIKLYRLRWQVELIFKTWKSYYKINRIKKVNANRIKCQLYASLILAIINWKIFRWVNHKYLKFHNKWLSIIKFTKYMRLIVKEQRTWLRNVKSETVKFIRKISESDFKVVELEKRKNRYNFVDIISLIWTYPEI